MCVCVYACVYACVCVRVCVYACVCVCVHSDCKFQICGPQFILNSDEFVGI